MAQAAISLDYERPSLLSRCTAFFVYTFERLIPDPYVFAVILTFLAAALAYAFAPNAAPGNILSSWYGGIFQILTFTFPMVLMLVTGYSLASAPVVASGLSKIASIPTSARSAISLTVFVAMVASWLNWLGLVVSALLAREIAKRVHLDFGWLVAAAYTGFVISTEGLSGSIALSPATPQMALNIVEKVTGNSYRCRRQYSLASILIPIAFLFLILPFVFRYLGPPAAAAQFADPEKLRAEVVKEGKGEDGQHRFEARPRLDS